MATIEASINFVNIVDILSDLEEIAFRAMIPKQHLAFKTDIVALEKLISGEGKEIRVIGLDTWQSCDYPARGAVKSDWYASQWVIRCLQACIFRGLQREDLVVTCFKEAWGLFRHMLRSGDEFLLTGVNFMMCSLPSYGHSELATQFLYSSLDVIEKTCSNNNIMYIPFREMLAALEDRKSEASADLERAFQQSELVYGVRNILIIKQRWASSLLHEGKLDEAVSVSRSCSKKAEEALGEKDLVSIVSLVQLSSALERSRETIVEAANILIDMSTRCGIVLYPEHRYCLLLKWKLGQLWLKIGDVYAAKSCFWEVMTVQTKTLGLQHKTTHQSIELLRDIKRMKGSFRRR